MLRYNVKWGERERKRPAATTTTTASLKDPSNSRDHESDPVLSLSLGGARAVITHHSKMQTLEGTDHVPKGSH